MIEFLKIVQVLNQSQQLFTIKDPKEIGDKELLIIVGTDR